MATLTRNLFRGQGERDHRLEVTRGRWPTDVAGAVYVVGPDKRAPGGHWFAEHGLVEKIHLVPDASGRIHVDHRRVDTPIARLKRRMGFLFAKVAFVEVSPFGVSNLANTNIASVGGRMFVGYDAGRPVEIDPETLRHVTYVGANDEWLQCAPGVIEPLCAVAAHPAIDQAAGSMWFVNYSQVSPPGLPKEAWLARWDLDGPVRRWRLRGMSAFDSIHDIKVTEHHLVFADLPFVVDPDVLRGRARRIRNQEHTSLWIVAKDAVEAVEDGGSVEVTEVRLPMPTGHLFADWEEVGGRLRVVLQQMPLSDLMISITSATEDHRSGRRIDGDYEGLVALNLQPSVIGCYEIDLASGVVERADVITDVERLWGGLLIASDTSNPQARAHQRQLWYASTGFDPDLVPDDWWRLYGDATDGIVAPADLPSAPVPGALARVDLDAGEVAEVYSYPRGSFPSPPTFVPRVGATGPDDGYVVVVVHADGDKAVEVFDADRIGAGPVAIATAPGFNPSLLLHSCWMADRLGPRPSTYRVSRGRDVVGALRGLPGIVASYARMARAMAAEARRA